MLLIELLIFEKILPQIKVEVFEGLGHGQFLHERPKEYAERLKIHEL